MMLEVGCLEQNTDFYDLDTFNLNPTIFEIRLNTLSCHYS